MIDIERIRGLLEKATPGPWEWRDDQLTPPWEPFRKQWSIAPGVLIAEGKDGTPGGDEIDRTNAELIVTLRNSAQALLAQAERVAVLEEALRPFAEYAEFFDECDQHPSGCPDEASAGEIIGPTVGDFRRACATLQERSE